MRFLEDFERHKQYQRVQGRSINTLNLFIERGIEMNEYQANKLFYDDRVQGYTMLTILEIIKYMIEDDNDKYLATISKTIRGRNDLDGVLMALFMKEFVCSSDKMMYKKEFLRKLKEYINKHFYDMFSVTISGDDITINRVRTLRIKKDIR
jgi:hypothetical protein